ncbi:hypothetical protein D3C71_1952780 [compost metagenome]
MAGGVGLKRFCLGHAGHLAHASKRVKFTEEGNNRLAVAEFTDEGRVHASYTAADHKAVLLKRVC